MRAVIASLRFHPGHFSQLMATARLLEEAGYDIRFRWHPQFCQMASGKAKTAPETLAKLVKLAQGDAYVLWFPSLKGFLDILVLRLLVRPVHVVYVFHEPYTSFGSYRAAGFSRLKSLKVYLIHLISAATVWLADAVILPSKNAFTAFQLRYSGRGKAVQVVPLTFDDEATGGIPARNKRQFISYIGTVAEDHAFDRFVDFAEQALQRNLVGDLKFNLATRSVLDSSTAQRLAPFVAAGRMHIQAGRPLSNEEINDAFSNSVVVWNAYRRSMQSGVLPKAYMFGTPVLVSDANPSEFFEGGRHGALISARYDAGELADAVAAIAANFASLSSACRAAFLEHFHYRASAKSFLAALTPPSTIKS